jgi:hypothetical protein
MKKSLMILLCFSMPLFLMAQESIKQNEIGLVFNNLNNFGLTYRTGSNKSLWRFNTLFISGDSRDETSDSTVIKQNSTGFGLRFGKEYRKDIVDNLELRFGIDLSFTFSQSKYNYNDKTIQDEDRLDEQTTLSPGIDLVFGLNYIINDKIVIGAELLPNLSYTFGTSTEKYPYVNNGSEVKSDISEFNYGLSNNSVLVSLAYRF